METTDQTPLNRLNLPLESFTNQTGLGAPVGANYFRVTASNGTITGTAVAITGTVASSASSGAAIKMVASNYLAGALALVGSSCCRRLKLLGSYLQFLVEYRNRGYVQSFHAHLVSLHFIEQFNIAQLVPTSGGAINFAALADKYGLSEADVCCLSIWEG
ncbi:hypothetical protein N7501_011711 [Penicillium viridicatum]|nr:hypothetical protein N7501_011711 [Penicillium viridicatum]